MTFAVMSAGLWAWNQFITSPPYVDPVRYPIRGIDVSWHNGMMNLDAARREGVEFIFIKASEGGDFRDPNFKINYWKAQHAGMKIGAYHFFRFDRDGVDQAVHFLDVVGNRQLDLPLVIDVEDEGNASGVALDTIQERLTAMVEYLYVSGRQVMFYTNRKGYEKYLMENFPGYPLWICSFSDHPIDADWRFWQYDFHGKVAGVRGDVDLNVFYGSRKDWEAYLSTLMTQ